MDAISSPGTGTVALARAASAMSHEKVQAEAAVKMAKKSMDVQAETAAALISTIPDVGRMVDVRA